MCRRWRLGVVGPTASGKTALAVELGLALGGEIVCVDSVQAYRGFDVGSAKPTAVQRRVVAHHLLDVASAAAPCSAGRFAVLARAAMEAITARGRRILLCGGAGLYLRAVLEGLAALPHIPPQVRAEVQQQLAQRGAAACHALLAQVDAPAARRIAPQDAVRIARALEVYQASGQPLSAWHAGQAGAEQPGARPRTLEGWLFLGCSWPRPALRRRIARRTAEMLAQGWVEETRTLLGQGCSPHSVPMRAIGYQQIVACLEGRRPWERLEQEIALRTGQFAKRQLTWLRNQGFGDPEAPTSAPRPLPSGAWSWWLSPRQAAEAPQRVQEFLRTRET